MKWRNQNENPFIIDKTVYHLITFYCGTVYKKAVTEHFLFNSIVTTINFVFSVFGIFIYAYVYHSLAIDSIQTWTCVLCVYVVCRNRDICILLLNFWYISNSFEWYETWIYGTEFGVMAVEIWWKFKRQFAFSDKSQRDAQCSLLSLLTTHGW